MALSPVNPMDFLFLGGCYMARRSLDRSLK